MSLNLLSFLSSELRLIKGKKHLIAKLELIENIPTNPSLGRWFYQINIFLLLSCLQSIFHYFFSNSLIDLITFNYLALNQIPTIMNVNKILLNFAIAIFYYYTYFRFGKSRYFALYKQILFKQNQIFMLGSKFEFWKYLLKTQLFYQVLIVLHAIWVMSAYLQFCVALFHSSFDSILLHVLAFMSMTVCFILFSASCLLVVIGTTTGCFGVFLSLVLFERIKMIKKNFIRQKIDRFTSFRLSAYRRFNFKTMGMLFELNTFYGPLLLCFLITATPSNSIAFVGIISYEISIPVHVRYAGAVIVTAQMSVIIFFHFVAALVSKKIHKPYKLVNSQFVRYQKCSSLSHIRIAYNIQTFLVKKAYGITYNWNRLSFGLVSMFAFFKFFLLYR